MDKKLELLDSIILSVKSQSTSPTPKQVVCFTGLNDVEITSNATQFNFDLKPKEESKDSYGFRVQINKCSKFYYIKNWADDRSAYFTKISVIFKKSNYYSWDIVDEFIFDEEPLDKQRHLFQLLMDNYKTDLKNKSESKYEVYLKEAKKLYSKDVIRDEKLDQLLNTLK